MDKMQHRTTSHNRDNYVTNITKTWLDDNVELAGRSMFQTELLPLVRAKEVDYVCTCTTVGALQYTASVLAYVHFCTDTLLHTRTVSVFLNQKPWLDSTVWHLLNVTG